MKKIKCIPEVEMHFPFCNCKTADQVDTISLPRKPVKWVLYGAVIILLLAYMIIYGL